MAFTCSDEKLDERNYRYIQFVGVPSSRYKEQRKHRMMLHSYPKNCNDYF